MSLWDDESIAGMYGPAMQITTQSEADEYLEALVQWSMEKFRQTRSEATKIHRGNIGYYSGYYSDTVARRVMTLFRCSHPYFGTARPTPEEAFNIGRRWADRNFEGVMRDEAS